MWLLKKANVVGQCDFDATMAELLSLTKSFLSNNLK